MGIRVGVESEERTWGKSDKQLRKVLKKGQMDSVFNGISRSSQSSVMIE